MNQLVYQSLMGLFLLGFASAEPTSNVGTPPENTLSPNKRYGVTIPSSALDTDALVETNSIIELKSMRVLGVINNETAFAHMNHNYILPAWWAEDDSFLLWQVEGKWGMYTQMLVNIQDGKIQWELDILKVLERAILDRTEAASSKLFLQAKKQNWGNGSAYPEKFTIDSAAENANKEPLKFPIHFHVSLTSNPKQIEWLTELDSSMEATLNSNGEITISGFHVEKSPSH